MAETNGLLDFFKTPEGQGLLSAGFGAAAGARPGQPWNTLGRGGMAGLMGFANAQDRELQTAERAEAQKDRDFNRQYRQVQTESLNADLIRKRGEQAWRAGLPAAAAQGRPTYGAGDEGPTMKPGDPNALLNYAMQPNSPFADDVLKSVLVKKPQEAFTLGVDQIHFGPDGKPVAYGPTKRAADSEDDAKIKQFKFAQARGYKGSFEQFVVLGPALMAAAAAPLRDAQIGNINAENAYNLPPPIAPTPRPAAGGSSVSVGGKTYSFPNAAAAAAFKKQAGIQ